MTRGTSRVRFTCAAGGRLRSGSRPSIAARAARARRRSRCGGLGVGVGLGFGLGLG